MYGFDAGAPGLGEGGGMNVPVAAVSNFLDVTVSRSFQSTTGSAYIQGTWLGFEQDLTGNATPEPSPASMVLVGVGMLAMLSKWRQDL